MQNYSQEHLVSNVCGNSTAMTSFGVVLIEAARIHGSLGLPTVRPEHEPDSLLLGPRPADPPGETWAPGAGDARNRCSPLGRRNVRRMFRNRSADPAPHPGARSRARTQPRFRRRGRDRGDEADEGSGPMDSGAADVRGRPAARRPSNFLCRGATLFSIRPGSGRISLTCAASSGAGWS